jgi:23S rRNA (uracil1939-C5)-methyltransferase
MAQSNAKNEITLEIDSLSYGPYGIGRYQGKAVMIPNTAPGDTAVARVIESKERYAVAELLRLNSSSPARQSPPCPYVGECGGCSWQHVLYQTQLKAKEQSVEDALRRIGKLQDFDLRPIIPSANEYHYRRRIRLHLDTDRRLGFYHASSHRLVEIDACLIAVDPLNDCIDAIRDWVRNIRGSLEYVEIISGDRAGEVVIVAKSTGDFSSNDEIVCRLLLEKEPGIRGLILAGRAWRRVWGETRISIFTEEGIRLRAEADVFTQVNPEGNRRILSELLAMGDFTNHDRVLELYSGAGNFTLSVAKRVREIVAVEAFRPSITDGKLSSQLNGIGNIHWVCNRVPAAVERLKKRGEQYSKIILDPPRAGAKGIEGHLGSFAAEKILYVSCNPTTLARDLAAFTRHRYKLALVQPIDLFPHTFHVETLALMTQ